MTLSCRSSLLALVLCLAAPSSFAQDMDDLLAPLSPTTEKGKGKNRGKVTKRPAAKGTKKVKKPVRGAKAQPPEPEPVASPAPEDDLLTPLVQQKTEVLVKLQAPVRGARLFIDDKEVGAVPKTSLELTPGEHTVIVRRPGYRDFSRRLLFKEGTVTEVGVALEAVAGFISVKADVAGARVSIDGEDKGGVPIEGLVVTPGSHEVVVTRSGFRPELQRITVRAGRDYTIDVAMRPDRVASADEPRVPILTPSTSPDPVSPLSPEPEVVARSTPITQRWYFWAGVGAVVAAAAVGTVVATQPLDPNDVCGRTCDSVINPPGLRF